MSDALSSTVGKSVIAYVIAQEGETFLCVLDDGACGWRTLDSSGRGFYRFAVNDAALLRLAAEAAARVAAGRNIYTAPK